MWKKRSSSCFLKKLIPENRLNFIDRIREECYFLSQTNNHKVIGGGDSQGNEWTHLFSADPEMTAYTSAADPPAGDA